MTAVNRCESCGMSMEFADDHGAGDETIPYCRFCTTAEGELEPFADRFEKMVSWSMRNDGLDRQAAEAKTRDHMGSMPAWENHPNLRS